MDIRFDLSIDLVKNSDTMKRRDLLKETSRLLKTLPEETSWDDLMYQIYVRKKIEAGLRDSAAGRVATSKQIRKKLKLA